MPKVSAKKFGELVDLKLQRLGVSLKDLVLELQKTYGSQKITSAAVRTFLSGSDGDTVTNVKLSRYTKAINALAAKAVSSEKISQEDIDNCYTEILGQKKVPGGTEPFFSDELLDGLYHYPGGYANAVRLWGSSHQSIVSKDLRVRYTEQPIEPAVDFRPGYFEFVEERKSTLRAKNIEFFNGPCARLLSFKASPPEDGPGSASEKPILELHFGPVGWYEYSFLRSEYDKTGDMKSFASPRARMIDLRGLLISGDISNSKTSNIVDTATTVITNDGFAGYQARSGRVSASATFYTSAIAENINRWKDECLLNDLNQLVDPRRHYSTLLTPADHELRPRGRPNPFWTVRRGIDAELADKLSAKVDASALRLTGISFDLGAGHPDLLFVAFIDLSRDELARYYAENLGAEAGEGRLRFTPANFGSPETQSLLSAENWTAGGKASFVRAIEYLNSLRIHVDDNFLDAFNLARSNSV